MCVQPAIQLEVLLDFAGTTVGDGPTLADVGQARHVRPLAAQETSHVLPAGGC